MTKQEIRKTSLSLRVKISDRELKNKKILERILDFPVYKQAKTVMTFVSYKSEPDTHNLILNMIKDGKRLCAPVCFDHGVMNAFCFDDFSSLKENEMGILEPCTDSPILPEDIDLIFVPGCAFNQEGFRIGYGGGYYDRFLPKTRGVACGIFYDEFNFEFTPAKTDVCMDYIITDKNLYDFRKGGKK